MSIRELLVNIMDGLFLAMQFRFMSIKDIEKEITSRKRDY